MKALLPLFILLMAITSFAQESFLLDFTAEDAAGENITIDNRTFTEKASQEATGTIPVFMALAIIIFLIAAAGGIRHAREKGWI